MRSFNQKKALDKMMQVIPKGRPMQNSLLVIFNNDHPGHHAKIKHWIATHKDLFSKYTYIGLEPKNKEPKATIFPIIGKRDFNWLGGIKQEAIERVIPNFVPEMILVLHKGAIHSIDFLAKAYPSKIKVSHDTVNKDIYNIMLDTKQQLDWDLILTEVDKLLPKVEFS